MIQTEVKTMDDKEMMEMALKMFPKLTHEERAIVHELIISKLRKKEPQPVQQGIACENSQSSQ